MMIFMQLYTYDDLNSAVTSRNGVWGKAGIWIQYIRISFEYLNIH